MNFFFYAYKKKKYKIRNSDSNVIHCVIQCKLNAKHNSMYNIHSAEARDDTKMQHTHTLLYRFEKKFRYKSHKTFEAYCAFRNNSQTLVGCGCVKGIHIEPRCKEKKKDRRKTYIYIHRKYPCTRGVCRRIVCLSSLKARLRIIYPSKYTAMQRATTTTTATFLIFVS